MKIYKNTVFLISLLITLLADCETLETVAVKGTKIAPRKSLEKDKTVVPNMLTAAKQGDARAMFRLGIFYQKGIGIEVDVEEGFQWFLKAAEKGHSFSMGTLGTCYENGRGINKDLNKAAYWYRKAADHGVPEFMCKLSVCYQNGYGVEKNQEKAFFWFQKAAEVDNPVGMFGLGDCLMRGAGTPVDEQKGFYWYKKAAEKNLTAAMKELGICYYYGKGTEKNLPEAFRWFKKGADSGDVNCMRNLFSCYYYGEGISKSKTTAIKWAEKAAKMGDDKSKEFLQDLKQETQNKTPPPISNYLSEAQAAAKQYILKDLRRKGFRVSSNLSVKFDQRAASPGLYSYLVIIENNQGVPLKRRLLNIRLYKTRRGEWALQFLHYPSHTDPYYIDKNWVSKAEPLYSP